MVTYSSSHCGQLSVGVISRSDFDNIGGNKIDSLKTADDRAELAGGPSTSLGSTSSRGKGRVKGVDVDA